MTAPILDQLDLIERTFRQTRRWEQTSPTWVYLARLRRFVVDLEEVGITFNRTSPPRTLVDMAKLLEWAGREISDWHAAMPDALASRAIIARRDANAIAHAIRRIEAAKVGVKTERKLRLHGRRFAN